MSKGGKEPTLVHRKIAVLGFRAVGKSSLTNSFVTGTFSEAYDPTIESTHQKTIRFKKVHFATDIVDTAGMVRPFFASEPGEIDAFATDHLFLFFTPFTPSCLQDEYSRLSRNASLGVHGYVLVFSIASRRSFELINLVNDSLLNTLGDAPDVPRVLVGSMKDLEDQRQVSHEVRFVNRIWMSLTCMASIGG